LFQKHFNFEQKVTYQFELEVKTHTCTIKKINEIQVDPKQYDEQLTIQILDLIFTQNFNYSCIGINRSFFKEGLDFYELGFGLQLWRGAYSSVRPSEVGLTWNVDSMFFYIKLELKISNVKNLNYFSCKFSIFNITRFTRSCWIFLQLQPYATKTTNRK